jgi:hypothetical protein
MARRRTNKSAKIREAMAANPTASPSAIVKILGEQKIKVSPTLVSNVKARVSGGVAVAGRRGPGRPKKATNGLLNIEGLVAAKKFADHMGGVAAASQALATLARLS